MTQNVVIYDQKMTKILKITQNRLFLGDFWVFRVTPVTTIILNRCQTVFKRIIFGFVTTMSRDWPKMWYFFRKIFKKKPKSWKNESKFGFLGDITEGTVYARVLETIRYLFLQKNRANNTYLTKTTFNTPFFWKQTSFPDFYKNSVFEVVLH